MSNYGKSRSSTTNSLIIIILNNKTFDDIRLFAFINVIRSLETLLNDKVDVGNSFEIQASSLFSVLIFSNRTFKITRFPYRKKCEIRARLAKALRPTMIARRCTFLYRIHFYAINLNGKLSSTLLMCL